MTNPRGQQGRARAHRMVVLPQGKGRELMGLALLTLALLLGASLISYHPDDSSFLHQSSVTSGGVQNWIGPVGAQISSALYALLGVTVLLLPALLLIPAWKRLRPVPRPEVPGRSVGAVLMVAALPPLAHILMAEISWHGVSISTGGILGRLLGEAMAHRLNLAGALMLLFAILMVGGTLLIQSSLVEMVIGAKRRVLGWLDRVRLSWARRRRKEEKEKVRRRVLARKASREQRKAGGDTAPALLNLPLRVSEKKGEKPFGVRKRKAVSSLEGEAESSTKKPTKGSSRPQKDLFDMSSSAAQLPPVNILSTSPVEQSVSENELVQLADLIQGRCREFGIEGTVEGISPGPVVTVFEFQPGSGIKVARIVNLQDELALALKAEAVRIDRIPGRSTLGIEVPNRDRAMIHLGHLLAQPTFERAPSVLTLAIGTTLSGQPYYADLATMPHLLVAGATGSGKSVAIQSMITSILYKATREEVQLILIDPKRVELGVYAKIPHLKTPVVVDADKAANGLRWAVAEMERRYRLLAEVHSRSLASYNNQVRDPALQRRLQESGGAGGFSEDAFKPLPFYVIIIDELADLLMVSSDVETAVARLAQMARAVGIHLIIATQRPSVDVLTGTIKANFPCRMAFATASRHDSRTILDQPGTEKLLGQGDMLFMPPGSSRVVRLHGGYVSEQETERVVKWLKRMGPPELDTHILESREESSHGSAGSAQEEELYDEAARIVVAEGKASASFLQRRMRIGFSRAARLIDIMEQEGVLGPAQGSKSREVLVGPEYFAEIDEHHRES